MLSTRKEKLNKNNKEENTLLAPLNIDTCKMTSELGGGGSLLDVAGRD